MTTSLRRPAPLVLLAATAVSLTSLAACGKKPDAPADPAAATQTIGPDNIAIATSDTLSSGPSISGTLAADREARLRAEIGGAVLQTFAEAGQRVSEGTVLARIDDASVRDAAISARSAVTQATVAAQQAERELQRARSLAAAGAIAERDVEGAERANLSNRILVTLEVAATDADASGYEPIWQAGKLVGFVTSGGYGHTIGKSLAMAMVDRSVAAPGTALTTHIVGQEVAAKVIASSPYDPTGRAMRA